MDTVKHRPVVVVGAGRFGDVDLRKRYQQARPGPQRGLYAAVGKRCLDVVFVLLSLPIVLPIIGMCALALWFEGGRPFYSQERLGRGGKVFKILKLRTMVRDAETLLEQYLSADPELRDEWETTQKLKHDPRTTAVGRMLRVTSLDELPQLFNVLMGQMSLVGARPIMLNQQDYYREGAGYYVLRPGLTGPWQVGDRNATTFGQRVDIDNAYCRNVSLAGDLRILFKTVLVVLRGTGY